MLERLIARLARADITIRIYFAAAILSGITVLAKVSERPGIDQPAFVPVESLAALPMQLGSWRGEPSEVADVLNITLDAKVALDRVYLGSNGQFVYVHLAAFDHFRQIAHHHPRVCYGGAGWQVVGSQMLEIPGSGSGERSQICELLTFANRTDQIYVLYWYQVGTDTSVRPDGVRTLWWRVRGQRPLPPQVKVLMQASGPDEEAARSAMLELAEEIYAHVRHVCGPENLKKIAVNAG